MCGLAGIYLADSKQNPSEILLKDLISELKHRGPDAQQVLSMPGIGLAHARLSIIDLDHGSNQPMIDRDTGNVIVFNGEIYNYIELRAELISLGYKFDTQSDTEVILKAYNHWGVDCLNKFNGMWAFVIFDKRTGSLFASRDRLGVKPFVYGINEAGDLIFASEAKAIVNLFAEFRVANKQFLYDFVEKDFFACYKETFYKKIMNLLPGHYFITKNNEIPQQKRYWNWTPGSDFNNYTDKDAIEHFRSLLIDSIKLRFRADVPVGSCLSGGLDSSTIVGLATSIFNKPIHTFSCIYPNTPEFDESYYINESVKKFNSIATYTEPHQDDFIKAIYDSVTEQDGPTGGPSILSQRAVMELASRDVKVVLDGQGADELLGGYHSYFRYSLMSHAREFRNKITFKKLYSYYANASQIKKRIGHSVGTFPKFLYLVNSPTKFYTSDLSDTQLHYMQEFPQDDLNTILLEHVFTNLPNLLHYEDRNSMRFSIESRLPFLDYRLVEFAFSLSHKYKIRGSTTKWLLNNVAKDILPTEVWSRKDKMGFTTPAHTWFLQNNNILFFKKYLNSTNEIFAALSPYMQSYLLTSFDLLSSNDKITPASSGNINALWRHFTANIWLEKL